MEFSPGSGLDSRIQTCSDDAEGTLIGSGCYPEREVIMRVGLVRKIGFTLVALGVVGLGGCNDDPLDFDEQTAVRMFTNPSFMVVQTGDTVQLVANGINAGNEPTFQAVTATIASCGGSGSISVIESDQQTSIQPPQIYDVIGGAALGGACVVVQSGSVTDTVDVVVVGGTLNVTSAPTLIIAGTGGTVVVELVGTDGTPVIKLFPTEAQTLCRYRRMEN